jgi:hypothetical protein
LQYLEARFTGHFHVEEQKGWEWIFCPISVLPLPRQIRDRFLAIPNDLESVADLNLFESKPDEENVIIIIFGQQNYPGVHCGGWRMIRAIELYCKEKKLHPPTALSFRRVGNGRFSIARDGVPGARVKSSLERVGVGSAGGLSEPRAHAVPTYYVVQLGQAICVPPGLFAVEESQTAGSFADDHDPFIYVRQSVVDRNDLRLG